MDTKDQSGHGMQLSSYLLLLSTDSKTRLTRQLYHYETDELFLQLNISFTLNPRHITTLFQNLFNSESITSWGPLNETNMILYF